MIKAQSNYFTLRRLFESQRPIFDAGNYNYNELIKLVHNENQIVQQCI